MKKFKLFLKTWVIALATICVILSVIAAFAAAGYYIGKVIGPIGIFGLFLVLFSGALSAAVTLL